MTCNAGFDWLEFRKRSAQVPSQMTNFSRVNYTICRKQFAGLGIMLSQEEKKDISELRHNFSLIDYTDNELRCWHHFGREFIEFLVYLPLDDLKRPTSRNYALSTTVQVFALLCHQRLLPSRSFEVFLQGFQDFKAFPHPALSTWEFLKIVARFVQKIVLKSSTLLQQVSNWKSKKPCTSFGSSRH